jgi:hypothetical protein
MNGRYQGNLLKELRLILQDVKKRQSETQEAVAKPVEKWTLLLSLLAIITSGITLYFQFFYEKNDLRANFISAEFTNDSTLVSTIIYHNKGNSYATVLGNSIVFYQDSSDIENKSFQFNDNKIIQDYHERFDPLILSPGQQIHKNISQVFNFNHLNFKEFSIDPSVKVKLALAINYINHNGYYSTNFIPVGWVKLDSNLHVDDYIVNYKTEILSSDTYYTGMHKNKK